jgi:hypothetical protein
VVERSPEKAGVGGSTPSLATIIPKDLAVVTGFLQPKVQPKIDHCTAPVSMWALSSNSNSRNFPCGFQARLLIRLRIQGPIAAAC